MNLFNFWFRLNRHHHPFFCGRKASISKKAFGRVFIFSLISSKVLASSSDGPVLHLKDDINALEKSTLLTQIHVFVCELREAHFIPLCLYVPLHEVGHLL